MATTRKTITLTQQQDEWVKAQIAQGDYSNDSEYFRDLIRRDQSSKKAESKLRQLLDKAEASGISESTLAEVWTEAELRHQAKLEKLHQDTLLGIEQLERGEYDELDDNSLDAYAQEIKNNGRRGKSTSKKRGKV
ncbi:addiction module antidote protein, CC2985 family (plasmid) [Thalassoporum mexicanum PCC 7367]|uniref:type II toxin-antitoxin system ParD family antitoxin n=1 Tax=Thalassoporum mexicanum TaxID=3457544 RepID=UPI00029FBB38|nr:addiction module antidote protein, CC2985 family [Pseudanabaena sp. PCC 7367]